MHQSAGVKHMKSVSAFSCSNEKCLDYGKKDSGNIVVHNRHGKHDEIRMLKCKTCGSYFSERKNTALYNCKLQKDKALEVIYQLSKGYSIRKINRLTGVSRDAISRLAHIEWQYANSLCDELVRYLKHKKLLFDEVKFTTALRSERTPKNTCIAALP